MRTHCIRNWVCTVKLTTKLQLSNAKAASIFDFKRLCECSDKICPVIRPFLPLLFLLENASAQIPIHLNTAEIYASDGTGAGSLNDFPCIVKKIGSLYMYKLIVHLYSLQVGDDFINGRAQFILPRHDFGDALV